jgi:hypothetical protein
MTARQKLTYFLCILNSFGFSAAATRTGESESTVEPTLEYLGAALQNADYNKDRLAAQRIYRLLNGEANPNDGVLDIYRIQFEADSPEFQKWINGSLTTVKATFPDQRTIVFKQGDMDKETMLVTWTKSPESGIGLYSLSSNNSLTHNGIRLQYLGTKPGNVEADSRTAERVYRVYKGESKAEDGTLSPYLTKVFEEHPAYKSRMEGKIKCVLAALPNGVTIIMDQKAASNARLGIDVFIVDGGIRYYRYETSNN